MFINTGGNYEGMGYSTMYHCDKKYDDVSPNQKYYIHMGYADDDLEPLQQHAVLVFSIDTNEMVYAETVNEYPKVTEEYEAYQHRMAKALYEKLDWLRN